ncbi:MAG: hypothetical protein WKG32_19715 [Gemmatimonadaceae bacterium]
MPVPRGCDATFELPSGFCATVFAADVGPVRHLAVSAAGDVYAALWREGQRSGGVLALRDTNGDGRADLRARFGPEGGSGIALRGSSLFLGAWSTVYRWTLRAGVLVPDGAPVAVVEGIPELEHGARSVVAAPDGRLYVNIGAPSNVCERAAVGPDRAGDDPCAELVYSGGVWAFDAAGVGQRPDVVHRFATGLRHTVALGVDPATGELYGAPHGMDHLRSWWPAAGFTREEAAAKPPETLFRIERGGDYGFPYCYFEPAAGGMVLAPAYGGDGERVERCAGHPVPLATFPAHAAPLALLVCRGGMFPRRYEGGIFVALHGSLFHAPSAPRGYGVQFVPRTDGGFGAAEPFADGLARSSLPVFHQRPRPSGLAIGPDGSLYVADDLGGRIWRIIFRAL